MTKNRKIRPSEQIEKAESILKDFSDAIQGLKIDNNFNSVVDIIVSHRNKGKIITTGMGKAGIIMRKFASTLCSLGFSSAHLHPGEASHGDLGLITDKDILFVASTSGKTREVIEIIELAKNINVKNIIGITSHPDSPIREMADYVIDMGIIHEAGYLGLAPTTSILIMLALTDCIALISAEKAGITKEDYSKYHHGGYLGSIARGDDKIF